MRAFREFTADIDVGCARIHREAGDHHALDQLMRILVDDVAVLERARLGLVGVTDQIDRPLFVGLDEAPFHAARKTGAAAAAQAGVFDFVDNLGARHR